MTRVRPPLTVERAMLRVADLIGFDGMAEALSTDDRPVSERTVRNWSHPDTPERMPLEHAPTLDRAYQAAGGEGAPMLEWHERALDQAREPGAPRLPPRLARPPFVPVLMQIVVPSWGREARSSGSRGARGGAAQKCILMHVGAPSRAVGESALYGRRKGRIAVHNAIDIDRPQPDHPVRAGIGRTVEQQQERLQRIEAGHEMPVAAAT